MLQHTLQHAGVDRGGFCATSRFHVTVTHTATRTATCTATRTSTRTATHTATHAATPLQHTVSTEVVFVQLLISI